MSCCGSARFSYFWHILWLVLLPSYLCCTCQLVLVAEHLIDICWCAVPWIILLIVSRTPILQPNAAVAHVGTGSILNAYSEVRSITGVTPDNSNTAKYTYLGYVCLLQFVLYLAFHRINLPTLVIVLLRIRRSPTHIKQPCRVIKMHLWSTFFKWMTWVTIFELIAIILSFQ